MNYLKQNIEFLISIELLSPSYLSLSQTTDGLIAISKVTGYSLDDLVFKRLDLKRENQDIRLIILDIDGVMTDGGMYFTENGDQIKKYNTKDGMAIINLIKKGMQFGIISSGFKAEMVKARANMLGIQRVYVGRDKKLPILSEWVKNDGITFDQVAYVGDDINDLEVMNLCGLTACPKNAVKPIKEIADIILSKNGGDGCVREFLDSYFDY